MRAMGFSGVRLRRKGSVCAAFPSRIGGPVITVPNGSLFLGIGLIVNKLREEVHD